ncbi:MAG: methanogenesis marker 17 protein [Methanocalculus sp. MSAO_Arc1]|uniref:methanogenesis marker 17 protein n=1 Tax=Methanocalculus TaxID=71151 RepID=UPI000FF80713|nr:MULTISPECIES: methanogenesis marker 17 protein [unclassified Methanocalculus]MCP1662726.1 putative methanogenesis marker protein 17 [Methanocalculus sp. AMF5]RQD79962.1 MAG: methanogenesis marker 17 protein [Methanocalculus sp. MSAO_Arc1]
MTMMEQFEVECFEEVGRNFYRQITETVLLDHNLTSVISRLRIYIDPKLPIFVAVGTIRDAGSAVRVSDIGSIHDRGDSAVISVRDETYLATFLSRLYELFGHDNVDQPDRFTIVISNVAIPAEFESLEVADRSETVLRDLIYAMTVIAPEGFKVRRQYYGKRQFFYAASENTLPEHVIEDIIRGQFTLIGEELT